MAKIKVLDEQLANQIAAGEVVERPSSVVKELVENAIDAGSTTIDVTIEEGGLTLIRVVDNGAGIAAEDLLTAFQRHATSKIATSSDLFRIASLGFRGEALPSIAAVARITCVSADADNGLARRLKIEGGNITADEPANAPQGTDMSVRDLFYNTPARLKYMKSIQTELGHISDYINRAALAHPGIAFTLTHNGNALLRTLGTGDRLQVIAAVYGTNAAKAMLEIAASDADYEITGYVSKPELTRANRNGITVIVNGRYIRSHAVNQSLLAAYHTLLPINRFPLAVLELGMHPSLLDVNVHPSKMEVRFSKEAELRALIEQAARALLQQRRYTPGLSEGKREHRQGPQYVQDAISFHLPETPPEKPYTADSASREAAAAYDAGAARRYGVAAPSASQPWQTAGGASERSIFAGNSGGIAPANGSAAQSSAPAAAGRSAYPPAGSGRAPSTGSPFQPLAPRDREYVPKDATERLYAKPDRALTSAGDHGMSGLEESNAARLAVYESGADTSPSAGDVSTDARASVDSATLQADAAASQLTNAAAAAAQSNASDSAPPPESASASYSSAPAAAKPAFPELHWIGQHHGTYIVAQAEDGLYLIDQHAAHERINYEYYLHKFGNPVAASQGLLVPLTLEFTPGEASQLRELLPLFGQAGVELEPFGSQTFLVRSYPEWLPQGDEQAVLEEMAELIITERKSIDIGKLREKAAIMCACKASIKANDRMSREEGEALLARLSRCEQPYTCPHGRPIIVHLSVYQLEKMFKRVMS